MNENKIKEIMQKLFEKTNTLLEDKMSKIKSSINSIKNDINTVGDDLKNDINNLRKDLNITKDKTKTELNQINRVLKEFDSSQHFLGEKYESQKEKINRLIKDNKKLFLENQKFHGQILDLEIYARENKLSTNQLEQYNRSSLMLEISGIPRRKNEDAIELIKIVASKADIKRFEENQIDVAHQTSRSKSAPIIVKFVKKNDRMNFYHQRKKFYNL